MARERAAGDKIEKEARERALFYYWYADIIKLNYNEGVFCRQKIENSGALLLPIRDITKLYYNEFFIHTLQNCIITTKMKMKTWEWSIIDC